METIRIILIVLMAIYLLLYIVSTLMIFDYLKKRDEKVNFFLIRLFMISYAQKYKEITKKEEGRIGFLFYLWVGSINLVLLLLIVYIIFI